MSSCWGKNLHLSLFGESHGPCVGIVIDGLPAGFEPDLNRLGEFMARRRPGGGGITTRRSEKDKVKILSGMKNGKFCGSPLCVMIENTGFRRGDYPEKLDIPRPGHADYTAHVKYGGYEDFSGGGHFSGRLTAPLCAAGGLCMQILEQYGIHIGAHLEQVGFVTDKAFPPDSVSEKDFEIRTVYPLTVNNPEAGRKMGKVIRDAASDGDSIGGMVECAASGVPAGIGAPFFDTLESRISSLMFAIPGVKSVSFGGGENCISARGSGFNDSFKCEKRHVLTDGNNHGGILGGISSGMPIIVHVAFKPTPSVSKKTGTLSLTRGKCEEFSVTGRHDPCIAIRAVVCTEAVLALVLADELLTGDRRPLGAEFFGK